MTVQDLYAGLTQPQVDAVNKTFVAGSQTDRFSTVVGPIVKEVTNRIQRRNIPVSKTPLAVPPELVLHVVWLILERVQGALTGFDWTPQQIKMVTQAHDVVDKQIQAGDYPITVPNDPAAGPTVTSGGGVTVVQRGQHRISFRGMRGLT